MKTQETAMNDYHEGLLARLHGMATSGVEDLEQAVKRFAFDTAERVELVEGEIVAWFGGVRHSVPVVAPVVGDDTAAGSDTGAGDDTTAGDDTASGAGDDTASGAGSDTGAGAGDDPPAQTAATPTPKTITTKETT